MAILALLFAVLAQAAGTILLAPILRRGGVTRGLSASVAWLMVMPTAGALATLVALSGQATPDTFRILSTALLLGAVITLIRRGKAMRMGRWRDLLGICGWERLLIWPAMVFVGIQALFAAHPQRLYDQLDYHLVVSKRVMAFGGFGGVEFDPHFYIAGPIEFAMLWVRSLVPIDLFVNAVGQAWVFVATLPPIVASAFLARPERRGLGLAIAALFLFPSLVPNNEIASILKPGAFLLASTFVLFMAAEVSLATFTSLFLPFVLLFSACNPTYIHVSLALSLVILLIVRPPLDSVLRHRYLILISAAIFGISVARSYLLTGSFFFPSDASFFGSPLSDEKAASYWHSIARSAKEPLWMGWLGFLRIPARNPCLVAWLLLSAGAAAYISRTSTSGVFRKSLPLLAFVCCYVAIWPLFYDGMIFSRFVAGYIGALFALTMVPLIACEGRLRKTLVVASMALGVGGSHLDVMVSKLITWNRASSFEAYATQFPRIATAAWVNRWVRPSDVVVADNGEKFFFDSAVLSGVLGPRERRAWDALLTSPQDTAQSMRVKAIVQTKSNRLASDELGSRCDELWRKLEPFGNVVDQGQDRILWSNCYFAQNPCPQEGDATRDHL